MNTELKPTQIGKLSALAFIDSLKNHDWFFDYSDDGRVWRAGLAAQKHLEKLATSDPVYADLHVAHSRYHFDNGGDWKKAKIRLNDEVRNILHSYYGETVCPSETM